MSTAMPITCPNCDAAMVQNETCPNCNHNDGGDGSNCPCEFCESLRVADNPPADTPEW